MLPSKSRRQTYRKVGKKSMCQGVRVKPNKCKKIRHCTVAKGTKRTYCRKKNAVRYTKRANISL